MSGGSSGGSGSSVGGGLVPIALGSDTNGSIRVPASFCGIFGLKPTYGRLSRGRSFPFGASLDHLGPFARSVNDLALAYDALQGSDPADPARPQRRGAEVRERLRSGAGSRARGTRCVELKLGRVTFMLDGVELPVRANTGSHTQPISFIGLPVVAVPVPREPMPIGVQIIAAPWREDIALRGAFALERAGAVCAPPPRGFWKCRSISPTSSLK